MPVFEQHAWEYTVVELAEYLIREHGDQGRTAAETVRRLATAMGLSHSEILEPDVLRSLLVQAGMPPEDLSLSAADERIRLYCRTNRRRALVLRNEDLELDADGGADAGVPAAEHAIRPRRPVRRCSPRR